MANPFQNRASSLQGPATDMVPVTPSDGSNLPDVAIALYVQTGGTVVFRTVSSGAVNRQVLVGDQTFLPVGVTRVMATGTTASGIHALVLA